MLWRFPNLSTTFVVGQAAGLLQRGHDLQLFGLAGPGENSVLEPPASQLLEGRVHASRAHRNPLARLFRAPPLALRQRRFLPDLLNPWRFGRRAASLGLLFGADILEEFGPFDILHCQFGTLAEEVLHHREIGTISGKVIVHFRGHDISKAVELHGPRIYDRVFEQADFFIANCQYFRQKAIELGCDPGRITVLGSGIDCVRFSFQERRPKPGQPVHIATVGRLVEKKGLKHAIDAIAKLLRLGCDVRYRIIGDGPLKRQLSRQISSLGLAGSVELLGGQPASKVRELLESSELFLAPSVTSRHGDEDAPINSLKEAMAMGLPVVSTWHGGIPELVEDGVSGNLVPEGDSDAIADRLAQLIRRPECWPAMGRAGRARVEAEYCLDTQNDRLVEIYRRVLGAAP